jgi:hypothetical protein
MALEVDTNLAQGQKPSGVMNPNDNFIGVEADWRPQHVIDSMSDMTSRFNADSDYDEMIDYAMSTYGLNGRKASSLVDSALDEISGD